MRYFRPGPSGPRPPAPLGSADLCGRTAHQTGDRTARALRPKSQVRALYRGGAASLPAKLSSYWRESVRESGRIALGRWAHSIGSVGALILSLGRVGRARVFAENLFAYHLRNRRRNSSLLSIAPLGPPTCAGAHNERSECVALRPRNAKRCYKTRRVCYLPLSIQY